MIETGRRIKSSDHSRKTDPKMGKQRTLKKLTTPKSTPPGPSTSRSGIQKSNETADLSAVRRGIGRAIHEEYQQQLRDYCSRGELHRGEFLLS